MTTFKQLARSYNKMVNEAASQSKRKAAEIAKQYKEQEKQKQIASAQESVKRYNDYIESLISIHKNASSEVDWEEVSQEPEPPVPVLSKTHEEKALEKLNNFTPNFIEKVFGSKKKNERLEKEVSEAKKRDVQDFENAKGRYEEW